MIPGAAAIVSGITTAMEIPVLVVNNGDDAFGARISVTFDSVLTLSRVVPPIVVRYWMHFQPFDVHKSNVFCLPL